MSFKAAAIQMCSGVDPERNAADMARLVREAAAAGAIYVQTPEMTGALQRDRQAMRAVLRGEGDDLILREGRNLAAALGIYMHIGSTAIARDDGKIANRGFLIGPDGDIICRYDKIHMFDVDLDNGESWRESAAYQPGSEARIASLPFGELGFTICYDVRFPELFRRQAVKKFDGAGNGDDAGHILHFQPQQLGRFLLRIDARQREVGDDVCGADAVDGFQENLGFEPVSDRPVGPDALDHGDRIQQRPIHVEQEGLMRARKQRAVRMGHGKCPSGSGSRLAPDCRLSSIRFAAAWKVRVV